MPSQANARLGAADAKTEWLLSCDGVDMLSADCLIDSREDQVLTFASC